MEAKEPERETQAEEEIQRDGTIGSIWRWLPGAGLLVPKRFGLAWTNGSLRGWAIVGVALICAMVALWRKMLRRRALHDHLRMLAPAGGGGAPQVRRLADAAAALSQQNGGSVHSAVQQLLERL